MVEEAFQYRATPEDATTGKTAWQAVQTCREVYNHALTQEYKPAPNHDKPSYNSMQNQLPNWKRDWPEWKQVYSKCLQMAVRRIKNSESVLKSLQERGFNVGRLNWKSPRDYRSIKATERRRLSRPCQSDAPVVATPSASEAARPSEVEWGRLRAIQPVASADGGPSCGSRRPAHCVRSSPWRVHIFPPPIRARYSAHSPRSR